MATWADPPEDQAVAEAAALRRAYLGHGDQLGALEAEAYAQEWRRSARARRALARRAMAALLGTDRLG